MLPQITIIGNLKRIETKHIPSGKQVTKFQVECSEKNAKDEWENLYISGEVWEKTSEFVSKYFSDGSLAIVNGKLVTKVYEKQDGTKVYENKLLFPSVHFAPRDKVSDGGTQSNTSYKEPQRQQKQVEPIINYDDMESDMPF